jgi:hypothetical protein
MDQELNDRLLTLFNKPTPVKVIYEPLLESPSTQTRYCLPEDIRRKEQEKKRESEYLLKRSHRTYNFDLENKLRNQDIKLTKGQQNITFKSISNINHFTPGITMNSSSSNVAANVFYHL